MAQMATLIQPAIETPILIGGHTDYKKSSPGEPCFQVVSFGSVLSISTSTHTTFYSSQSMVQSANGNQRSNN